MSPRGVSPIDAEISKHHCFNAVIENKLESLTCPCLLCKSPRPEIGQRSLDQQRCSTGSSTEHIAGDGLPVAGDRRVGPGAEPQSYRLQASVAPHRLDNPVRRTDSHWLVLPPPCRAPLGRQECDFSHWPSLLQTWRRETPPLQAIVWKHTWPRSRRCTSCTPYVAYTRPS